ncbi:hypothetical protein HK100_001146 [Physocladia obscura]|uniref:Uncharacterized protein n=1 Tax=Physocladia obscura TaxID=109957 RepID=A0AAD5SXJ0_9FUNG|nr:hypothetical protein HK100_001146 [Physocladia obscura]
MLYVAGPATVDGLPVAAGFPYSIEELVSSKNSRIRFSTISDTSTCSKSDYPREILGLIPMFVVEMTGVAAINLALKVSGNDLTYAGSLCDVVLQSGDTGEGSR